MIEEHEKLWKLWTAPGLICQDISTSHHKPKQKNMCTLSECKCGLWLYRPESFCPPNECIQSSTIPTAMILSRWMWLIHIVVDSFFIIYLSSHVGHIGPKDMAGVRQAPGGAFPGWNLPKSATVGLCCHTFCQLSYLLLVKHEAPERKWPGAQGPAFVSGWMTLRRQLKTDRKKSKQ